MTDSTQAQAQDKGKPAKASIGEAAAKVEKARDKYLAARERMQQVNKDETEALNELNAAQKEFDAVVQQFKGTCGPSSDWTRQSAQQQAPQRR